MGSLDLAAAIEQERIRRVRNDPYVEYASPFADIKPDYDTPYYGANGGWGIAQAILSGAGSALQDYGAKRASNAVDEDYADLAKALGAQDTAALKNNPLYSKVAPILEMQKMQEMQEMRKEEAKKALDAKYRDYVSVDPKTGLVQSLPNANNVFVGRKAAEAGATEDARKKSELRYVGAIEDAKSRAAQNIARAPAIVAKDTLDAIKTTETLNPVKSYLYIKPTFQQFMEAIDDPTASSIELAKLAIRATEPELATNQGETDAIEASQSYPSWLKGSLRQGLEGGNKFDTPAREALKNLAIRAYQSRADLYNELYDKSAPVLQQRGLDPDTVYYTGRAPEAGTLAQKMAAKREERRSETNKQTDKFEHVATLPGNIKVYRDSAGNLKKEKVE